MRGLGAEGEGEADSSDLVNMCMPLVSVMALLTDQQQEELFGASLWTCLP